jgi:hypothetical protein
MRPNWPTCHNAVEPPGHPLVCSQLTEPRGVLRHDTKCATREFHDDDALDVGPIQARSARQSKPVLSDPKNGTCPSESLDPSKAEDQRDHNHHRGEDAVTRPPKESEEKGQQENQPGSDESLGRSPASREQRMCGGGVPECGHITMVRPEW